MISTAWPHLSAPALPVSHGPEPISPAPPLQRTRAGEFTFPSHYNSSWLCPTLKSSFCSKTKKQTSLWFHRYRQMYFKYWVITLIYWHVFSHLVTSLLWGITGCFHTRHFLQHKRIVRNCDKESASLGKEYLCAAL